MAGIFFFIFVALVICELVKGLSANGTPPVLQRFSWQMDLAYFMWSNIAAIRAILVTMLIICLVVLPISLRGILPGALLLGAIWGGIYWLFNRFWVGRFKFLPIGKKVFAGAADNKVDNSIEVLGISRNGVHKAYPVNMLFYHHQVADEIDGHPIWPTYCGLCRSGRIYNRLVDGTALEFTLVGAINYNAVFRDHATGSWWRQETGEAAKGPRQGKWLEDMPFEQLSLENWLEKYPDGQVLQYDPDFQNKYRFTDGILKYEMSLPGWHMQDTPPLVAGVQIGEMSRGNDWNQLEKNGLVMDQLGEHSLLLYLDSEQQNVFVYNRMIDGEVIDFDLTDGIITDTKTHSIWDKFGRCIRGEMDGKELRPVQSYKQFMRAWITFHPHTSFYGF